MASRAARPLHLRLATLTLVATVALGASAWKTEAEAYGALIDAYFQVIFAAGDDCAVMATKLEAWNTADRAAAEATSQALVAALGQLASRDDLALVEKAVDDIWESVTADRDKMGKFSTCLSASPEVDALVTGFDEAITRPVSGAISDARVRITEAEARARPADMPLAELSASTWARIMSRYRELVESYQGEGCAALARAHDYWYANYFEDFDQSSYVLMTEIGQMTPAQYETFKAAIATATTDKAAFDTSTACVAELEGDAARYLDRQSSTLAFITEMVLVAAPLNSAPSP